MKESYDEGVASHIGPESCASARKSGGEALTGERVGRVWSREDPKVQGADAVQRAEGNTGASIAREAHDPARSETPSTYGHTSHGNRGIPYLSSEERKPGAASGSLRTRDDDKRIWEVG